jgi:hypothetical protein
MSDELNSVGGPVAELQDGKVKFSASLEERLDVWPAHFVKNPGILSITATPEDGFNYNLDNVKAVLIKPYHSHTNDFSKRTKDFFAQVFPVFAKK